MTDKIGTARETDSAIAADFAASNGVPAVGFSKRFATVGDWLPLTVGVGAPALLWALLFIFVPPSRQNVPINDDAIYSRTAIQFAHGQGLNYYSHGSMPMLGLLLWITPFVHVLGDSHVTLRFATIVLSVVGLIGFYDLLRREGNIPRWPASIATATLGLGPLYFLVGSMFHTDIPALTFSLLALACYCRGLRSSSLSRWRPLAWWFGGMVLALLAVSTRQNAVAAPAAAGILLILRRWLPAVKRDWVFIRRPVNFMVLAREIPWVLGVVIPGFVTILIHNWFNARSDVVIFEADPWMILKIEDPLYVGLHTIGLYSLPVLLLPGRFSWRVLGVSLVLLTIVACRFNVDMLKPDVWLDELFPYARNCLSIYGQFEHGLYPGERPRIISREMQRVLTVLGVLGAGLVLARASERIREVVTGPLFFFTIFHMVILATCARPFDRYFLVLLPGGIAAAMGTGRMGRWRPGAVVACLTVFAFLSLASIRDFLTWNNAFWELGRRAQARGIDAEDIEGGFSWDEWHSPQGEDPGKPTDRPSLGLALRSTRCVTPNVNARYAISFSVLPGTRILDRISYHLWLAPQWEAREMYLLEPDPGSPLFVGAGTVGFLAGPSGMRPLLAAMALAPQRFVAPDPP